MKKNAEHETWSSISGALKRRCMDISDANVFLNDQLVPRKKLKKELQRYTAQEGQHVYEILLDTFYAIIY